MQTVDITYNTILERCKMLSAYEGKSLVDGEGESRYKDIRITDSDSAVVQAFISEGMKFVEGELSNSIELQVEYNDTKMVPTVATHVSEAKTTTGSFALSVAETLSSYVMYRWMADKVADRSTSYKSLFEEMLRNTKKIAWKKKRPQYEGEAE